MEPAAALINLIREAGPWGAALIFAYLYWEEKKERRACQAANTNLQALRVAEAQSNTAVVTQALTENITKLDALEEVIKAIAVRGA